LPALAAVFASIDAGADPAAWTGDVAAAAATPAVSTTAPASVTIRLGDFALFLDFMLSPPGATMNG
jgi:hypothetical protein